MLVIGAVLTAFWTYNTFDGRWGRISLPRFEAIESIHGTFGLWALLVFPAFVYYAFHRGQHRLVQPGSLAKLTQLGQPIGWYTLHRCMNTLILLALTIALFSGKMMDEKWLPQGELNHFWYYAHLASWLLMVLAIALHGLMSAKVGGSPLLLSMVQRRYRQSDSPVHWGHQIKVVWNRLRRDGIQSIAFPSSGLQWMEGGVWVSLLAAWLIPLFK